VRAESGLQLIRPALRRLRPQGDVVGCPAGRLSLLLQVYQRSSAFDGSAAGQKSILRAEAEWHHADSAVGYLAVPTCSGICDSSVDRCRTGQRSAGGDTRSISLSTRHCKFYPLRAVSLYKAVKVNTQSNKQYCHRWRLTRLQLDNLVR
jgi:hypothetical protein